MLIACPCVVGAPLQDLGWAGLLAGDVFHRPKANVLITVDGVTQGESAANKPVYKIIEDLYSLG